MRKVLVTGASGFIGIHTLNMFLEKGYEVHATTSSMNPYPINDKIQWHTINLLDSGQINRLFAQIKPSHLLHLAWYVEPGKYLNSVENLTWVQASIEITKAFYANDGHRAVFAGTCFEYDLSHGYLRENSTPTHSETLYGVCKGSLHRILQSYAKNSGADYAWGRVFYLYGPNENPKRVVPYIINSLIRGEYADCSAGEQIRDFLHVQDVAAAFVQLVDSDIQGAVNIASGTPVKLKQIFIKIAELLGKKELLRLGAVQISSQEPSVILADNNRMIHELGWQPKIDLETGLAETIKWWSEQKER